MNNVLLITREDIASVKEISNSVKSDKLNPFIQSAQIMDIAPLLGERLYLSVLRNPEAHSDLLNGGDYEHENEIYFNWGLKRVLALYSHARYTFGSFITDTPFGQVQKLNSGNSQPISDGARKTTFIEDKNEAFRYWQSVEDYLRRTEYNNFNCGCGTSGANTNSGGFLNVSKI